MNVWLYFNKTFTNDCTVQNWWTQSPQSTETSSPLSAIPSTPQELAGWILVRCFVASFYFLYLLSCDRVPSIERLPVLSGVSYTFPPNCLYLRLFLENLSLIKYMLAMIDLKIPQMLRKMSKWRAVDKVEDCEGGMSTNWAWDLIALYLNVVWASPQQVWPPNPSGCLCRLDKVTGKHRGQSHRSRPQ
jgi:hypothetical protein